MGGGWSFARAPFLIAGPCVVAPGDVLPRVAEALAGISERRGVPVCFSVPQPDRRAMLQLDCEGVEVVRPSALGRWWLQRRAVAEDVVDSVSGWRQRVRTTMRDEAVMLALPLLTSSVSTPPVPPAIV